MTDPGSLTAAQCRLLSLADEDTWEVPESGLSSQLIAECASLGLIERRDPTAAWRLSARGLRERVRVLDRVS